MLLNEPCDKKAGLSQNINFGATPFRFIGVERHGPRIAATQDLRPALDRYFHLIEQCQVSYAPPVVSFSSLLCLKELAEILDANLLGIQLNGILDSLLDLSLSSTVDHL